jgi:hypothetical protein
VISEETLHRNRTLHELISPITIASGRTQLLERHIQRSESLSPPERDLMLEDVTAVLDALQLLQERIQARVTQDERLSD